MNVIVNKYAPSVSVTGITGLFSKKTRKPAAVGNHDDAHSDTDKHVGDIDNLHLLPPHSREKAIIQLVKLHLDVHQDPVRALEIALEALENMSFCAAPKELTELTLTCFELARPFLLNQGQIDTLNAFAYHLGYNCLSDYDATPKVNRLITHSTL